MEGCSHTYGKDWNGDSSAASASAGGTSLIEGLWLMYVRS